MPESARPELLRQTYGREAVNRLSESVESTLAGARAALESFYHAFNNRDLELFGQVWLDDPGIQLNNPLGGIMRGYWEISALYEGIFHGPARVWVEFHDIMEYAQTGTVIFAGRERGVFSKGEEDVPLEIRTTRIFVFGDGAWRQVHHHGSIDDPALLQRYQEAVRG